MGTAIERVAELEWANYAATLSSARVTPGLDVMLRDNLILTSTVFLPTRDGNHACLLRSPPWGADDLIAEVTDFFRSRELPVAVYLSPACSPNDLTERLSEKGFCKQPEEESWMVLEGLPAFDIPSPCPGKTVRPVTRSEIGLFAEVFMGAFDMPGDLAAVVVQLLEPGMALPNVHHYLALDEEEQPIGTCSLLCYESFGVLGSAGVLREHRGRGTATALAVRAATDARKLGVETLMLQTAADTPLERFLRISGFKRAFTRSCYTLDDDPPG